jgi:cholera toxin transcriptional activator
VHGVPVANHGESKQQKCDQQQAGSFRGIDRVAAALGTGFVSALTSFNHGFIVRRNEFAPHGLVLHYASRSVFLPMPAFPGNPGRIARFGVFELDLAAGELRKNGARLRLQEQPLQVLALLLERAGDLVTRDEMRQKLWPADTFVDFDHSLNTAVNKLRETLGDSASSPRYIETLARRGYRFIAPVQSEEPARNAEKIAEKNNVGTAAPGRPAERSPASEKHFPQPLHPDLEIPIPHRALTRGLFALAQVMYLIFYLAALFHLRGVQGIAESFLPGWRATLLVGAVMITAGIGIPLRCYLVSAVGFDYQRLGEKFRRLFPFLLALDQLWAVAPFLLMQKIGIGAAFAASAALLYVPFSERTLIRMAYVRR